MNRGRSWTCKREWQSRLTADERRTFAQVAGRRVPTAAPAATAQQTVTHALQHGFERASVVPEKRLLATALKPVMARSAWKRSSNHSRRRRA